MSVKTYPCHCCGEPTAWNGKSLGWQTMESAPKDGSEIMAWNGKERYIVKWVSRYGFWWTTTLVKVFPTHWRPLPEPPK